MTHATTAAVYTTGATSSGDGRAGTVRTADGSLELDLRIPRELGGPGGGTNPEQLFAAGYAACFHSALRAVARERRLAIPDGSRVDAAVGLHRDDAGFALGVSLTAHLPGLPQQQADELLAAAHGVCPYSRAVAGNVEVALIADVAA